MQRYTKVLPTIIVTLLFIPTHSLNSYQFSVPTQPDVVEVPEKPTPEFVHVNPEEDKLVGEKAEPDQESKVDYTEVCNCWQYVKNNTASATSMAAMEPNSEATVGAVAIEWFGKVKHVSKVVQVTETGVLVHETNYHHCQFTERFIDFSSHRLAGFWTQ